VKKLLTTCFVISSIVLSPALRAEGIPPDTAISPETPALATEPTNESEGTPVGQAASEGSNAARKKRWQNIALAVGAVAVAVTALILIASNDGHDAPKKDPKGH